MHAAHAPTHVALLSSAVVSVISGPRRPREPLLLPPRARLHHHMLLAPSASACAASVRADRLGSARSLVPGRVASFAPRRAAIAVHSAVRTSAMAAAGVTVKEVPTTKIDGQKTGTSGLRKKAKEFSSGNYLANWVQSLFNALPNEQRVRSAPARRHGRAAAAAGRLCRARGQSRGW